MTETHAKNHVLTPSSYRGHVFGLTEIEHFSIVAHVIVLCIHNQTSHSAAVFVGKMLNLKYKSPGR